MLQVLVSTKETQGIKKNDFCHCDENEFLFWTIKCNCTSKTIERKQCSLCGSDNILTGIKSKKNTSTFKVVVTETSQIEYINQMQNHVTSQGHGMLEDATKELAFNLLEIAIEYDVGTILEKEKEIFKERILVREKVSV